MAVDEIITDFIPQDEQVITDFTPVNIPETAIKGAGGSWNEPKDEDSWAETLGKSVMQGLTFIPSSIGALTRFTDDLMGIGKPEGYSDLYDLAKEAQEFWTPEVTSKPKKYASEIVRTVTEMGTLMALTGQATLPSMATGAGLQKMAQAREEGATLGQAAEAGITQGAIEYYTEFVPVGTLLKPGLSFGRRLATGLISDLPGELLATAGEMAVVDEQILGKSHTLDEYLSALKDTAIVSFGVTGAMTTVSHPFIKSIEDVQNDVKKDPAKYADTFKAKMSELTPKIEQLSSEAEVIASRVEGEGGIVLGEYEGQVIVVDPETSEISTVPIEAELPAELPAEKFDAAFDEMVASDQDVSAEDMIKDIERAEVKPPEDKALNIITDESGAVDIAKFVELGKSIWNEGHITYQAFKTRTQEMVGQAWDSVKHLVVKVWNMVRDLNERLGQEGAIGKPDKEAKKRIREMTGQVKGEPTVTEPVALKASMKKAEQASKAGYKEGVKVGVEKALTPKEESLKQRIQRITGQVKDKGEISEPEALRAAMVKAVQAGRVAYRAGKSVELAKAKERFQLIGMRRQKIKAILDALAMPDESIKQITRKNFLLMTNFEFKQFMDDLKEKSLELEEKAIAKATLEGVIIRKRLRKYDNYRRVLELLPIHKMSTGQLFEFAEILDQFQEDDVFLTERELETVDKTDLKGIRTWREARERLAKEANTSIEELSKVKVTWWDKFRWDTPLSEVNPFYSLMVGETTKKLLQATERTYKVEGEVKELAKKANVSRKRTIAERFIPQDKQIMEYLEAPADMKDMIADNMTSEQLELAEYIRDYFEKALDHLINIKTLEKGRENYYTHIRRSFLETAKDDGLVKAFKEMFQSYQEEQIVFNILDEDTGNILPLEKFFQFSLHRTGALIPTQNVLKAFMTYVTTFEKKVALDELIPKIDIYAQALTPTKYTPMGLEIDRSLKKFVNKYINNKKGRHIDMGFVKQGDKLDLTIRALRTFTTLLDLGLNIPVGIASYVGEHVANFEMIGIKGVALALKRKYTAKGKAILNKYKAFTGRSVWEEFNAPGKEVTERLIEGLFGLFHQATVTANKEFLLASITEEEYSSGTISDERLALLRLEMGRFRVVPGTKSLVGSTSIGNAAMQYKTWAGAIARTVIKDAETVTSDLKNKRIGEALTTREAREIYRIIGLATAILIIFGIGDDKDRSTIGRLKYLVWRESLTILQAISPDMWLSTPRIIGLISQLGQNLKSLILIEEYKTKPGLKGVEGLKKQFTPAVLRKQDKKQEERR